MRIFRSSLPHLMQLFVVAISGIPHAISAEKYPNTSRYAPDLKIDRSSSWYKACLRAKNAAPPVTDIPARKLIKQMTSCDAENLYYDTLHDNQHAMHKADWSKVIACAFSEPNNNVLMMLYANGYGVQRNFNLAIKYACKYGGAPRELEGRVDDLASYLKEEPGDIKGQFDFCSHITSGYEDGHCEAISERQNTRERNKFFDAYKAKLNPTELRAFNNLMKAVNELAYARAEHETDLSGTARAAFSIQARAYVQNEFAADIGKIEASTLPTLRNADFIALVDELNKTYMHLMETSPGNVRCDYEDPVTKQNECSFGFTTITKTDVREAQEVWIRYRDAWMEYWRIGFPNVEANALQALLTARRINQLHAILSAADFIDQ